MTRHRRKIFARMLTVLIAVLLTAVMSNAVITVYAAYDLDKPTVVAAVYDGLLTIQATDETSAIRAIYVNGEEFAEPQDGLLTFRLQQFDSGIDYFHIQAIDVAGNASNLYMVQNPYYVNPTAEDDAAAAVPALPVNGAESGMSDSKATVTEHTFTRIPVEDENGEINAYQTVGKEFYTIVADSGKVFYLIIDHDRESNNVYFLTEVSENDLLNVTGNTYQTLTPDTTVIESETQIIVQTVGENNMGNNAGDGSVGNDNTAIGDKSSQTQIPGTQNGTYVVIDKQNTGSTEAKKSLNLAVWYTGLSSEAKTYIFIGAGAVVLFVVLYFVKIKGKKPKHVTEEEDDEDEEISVTTEDEEE